MSCASEAPQVAKRSFVFETERGGPFAVESFNHLVKKIGQKANLPFRAHAHMLRHACGYKLAGDGHAPDQSRITLAIATSPHRSRRKHEAVPGLLQRLGETPSIVIAGYCRGWQSR
jgi:integrase